MKLITTLAIIIGLSFSAIEVDKAAHFGAGYAITDIAESKFKLNALESFIVVYGIGVVKEMMDKDFDNGDMIANICGWAFKRLVFEIKF